MMESSCHVLGESTRELGVDMMSEVAWLAMRDQMVEQNPDLQVIVLVPCIAVKYALVSPQ
jgi:hypothetical protein